MVQLYSLNLSTAELLVFTKLLMWKVHIFQSEVETEEA